MRPSKKDKGTRFRFKKKWVKFRALFCKQCSEDEASKTCHDTYYPSQSSLSPEVIQHALDFGNTWLAHTPEDYGSSEVCPYHC